MKLLIVCYHYFREEKYKSGIYPVDQAMLSKQLEAIAKDYEFISQSELAEIIQGKKDAKGKNLCLITFDDGLSEQVNAFDYMWSKGIPSVYYAPTAIHKNNSVLEVHKLHYVRTLLDDAAIYSVLERDFAIGEHAFDMDVLRKQYRFDDDLSRKVKYFINFNMNPKDKSKLTEKLFSQVVSDEAEFSKRLYMDAAQLKKLAACDALGAHGSNHVPLATLSFEEAVKDVKESIEYLENLTSRPILSFAYPYGGKTAINEQTWRCFDGTNVLYAHSTIPGFNSLENLKSPESYYLLRIDTNDAPGGKNVQ